MTVRFASQKRLDRQAQRTIIRYLRERIATDDDPGRFARGLTANRAGLWRYRVSDYRLTCRIEDDAVVVLVLAVGHRSTVYS
jgi:mRNA interferase RelE/StbE